MQAYEPTFFSHPTTLVRVVRAGVGAAIAAVFLAAWATAGPGNYDRTPVARVTLPQVTIVGQRDAVQPAAPATVAGCERPDNGHAQRKLG